MEYFQLNLYQQGRQKVQKGLFGLRPEVVAAAPAAALGLLLIFFFLAVYLPRGADLNAQRQEAINIQSQIEAMIRASQIIKPVEKQFLELRQERVRLTPILQAIVETIPSRVWMNGLDWKPVPVTGRRTPSNDPFNFRKNELTLRGRAFSNPGQSPFGLANAFVDALVAADRLGAKYNVELGRTIESREQKPLPANLPVGNPTQLAPEFRSVLDFTIHCRIKEDQ